MDRNETITRIRSACFKLTQLNKRNCFTISLLLDHILSHRLAQTTLNSWAQELEGMVKRDLAKGTDG